MPVPVAYYVLLLKIAGISATIKIEIGHVTVRNLVILGIGSAGVCKLSRVQTG